jgi:hypothetical protein
MWGKANNQRLLAATAAAVKHVVRQASPLNTHTWSHLLASEEGAVARGRQQQQALLLQLLLL